MQNHILLVRVFIVFILVTLGNTLSVNGQYVIERLYSTDGWGNAYDSLKVTINIDVGSCAGATGNVTLQYRFGVSTPPTGNWSTVWTKPLVDGKLEEIREEIYSTPGVPWPLMQYQWRIMYGGYPISEIAYSVQHSRRDVVGNPHTMVDKNKTGTQLLAGTISGEMYTLEVIVPHQCEWLRRLRVDMGFGQKVDVQIAPDASGLVFSRRMHACVPPGAWTVYEVFTNGQVVVEGEIGSGDYDENRYSLVSVDPLCQRPDEEDPEDPEIPEVPTDDPPEVDKPEVSDPENPGPPVKTPPGTGGPQPIDPLNPFDDPTLESPELWEIDQEKYYEAQQHVLSRAEHVRNAMKDKMLGLMTFNPPGIGKVWAISAGSFYGRDFTLNLRPYASAISAVRSVLLSALVLTFILATARAIRQTI